MTCVIGFMTSGKMYMAGDKRSINDAGDILSNNVRKVFLRHTFDAEPVIIGVSGALLLANVLRDERLPDTRGKDAQWYMVNVFRPFLRDVRERHGIDGGEVMVGTCDGMYVFHRDMSFNEVFNARHVKDTHFHAIGAGRDYAMGYNMAAGVGPSCFMRHTEFAKSYNWDYHQVSEYCAELYAAVASMTLTVSPEFDLVKLGTVKTCPTNP